MVNSVRQFLSFTSPSNNHQKELGCLKPKSACPICFNPFLSNWHFYGFYSSIGNPLGRKGLNNNRNKASIKCALCSAQSRRLRTEINPFLPNQHFCGFYSVQRQMIILVKGQPPGQERVKALKFVGLFSLLFLHKNLHFFKHVLLL